MDRFLMQYISNKCTLILHESVKKSGTRLLTARSTPLSVFGSGKKIGP